MVHFKRVSAGVIWRLNGLILGGMTMCNSLLQGTEGVTWGHNQPDPKRSHIDQPDPESSNIPPIRHLAAVLILETVTEHRSDSSFLNQYQPPPEVLLQVSERCLLPLCRVSLGVLLRCFLGAEAPCRGYQVNHAGEGLIHTSSLRWCWEFQQPGKGGTGSAIYGLPLHMARLSGGC